MSLRTQKVVTFGEVMLRLSPPGAMRFQQATSFDAVYGGGEANVAVSLANFGLATDFVSRVPDNPIGLSCKRLLRQYGVGVQHVLIGGRRMGIYFLEKGASSRPSQVIYDRVGSAFSCIRPSMVDWDSVFEGCTWFHWTGVTPAVSKGAAETCLCGIREASARGVTISCDLNFRRKLWNWGRRAAEVMPEMVELCDVLIGNEEDSAETLGIHAEGTNVASGVLEAESYRDVCAQVSSRFPGLRTIAVTLRGSLSASHNTWSAVLWSDGKLRTARDYNIEQIVDRVGGGDSFAAGLIYGAIAYPKSEQQMLDFATAASCLKHTIAGDFNLVTVAEVENLLAGDGSGRISR